MLHGLAERVVERSSDDARQNQDQDQDKDKDHGQGEKMEIHLDSIKEHTGSFTQFKFTPTEVVEKMKKEEKTKSSARNKDNFDEIWSSL